jgi:hypothetical protein
MTARLVPSALITAVLCACSVGDAHDVGDAAGGTRHVPVVASTTQHGAATANPDSAAGRDEAHARADSALAALLPGALQMVDFAAADGRTGPGGRPFDVALRTPDTRAGHARRFGAVTLGIQLRTRLPDLAQYPCASCHTGRRLVLADERIADAHADLRVVHPREAGATCATCHSPDDVEQLTLRGGERVSLDHAYRVCAQCHFQQVDAWAGGAHGKRLDGWQGRRVVMGCADCHDPHAPAFAPRLPFQAPRLHRTRDRQ